MNNAQPNRGQPANSQIATSPSTKVLALSWAHRILTVIARFFFVITRGRHGRKIPEATDPILLESATAIAEKIRKRETTSTKVLQAFIARIREINAQLNCVTENRFDDALRDAATVDELIESNKYTYDQLKETKPFLGVPISIKGSIAVKGMLHTSGMWSRRDKRSTVDAEVIPLLREAGAIPFVTTNVPEACVWMETYNPVYGKTVNPHDSNRIAGGSSGGEACLLAAAGSPFGIGTDTGGSIRMPALFNGVFGHKTSPFIVPTKGQYPILGGEEQESFLSVGPLTRFAVDLKPMLKMMAGANATKLNLDAPVTVANINFFYQDSDGGECFVSPVDHDQLVAMDKVIHHLRDTVGAKVTRVSFAKLKNSIPIWTAAMASDNADGFDKLLADSNGKINPYYEILKSLVGMSNHSFISLLIAAKQRWDVRRGSPELIVPQKEMEDLRREFREMLGDDGVFIYPTHPTVAPYHHEPVIRPSNFSYTGIFTVLGLPVTAVPVGTGPKDKLPIGVQVVANDKQDRLCLAVASELETAFGGWVRPRRQT